MSERERVGTRVLQLGDKSSIGFKGAACVGERHFPRNTRELEDDNDDDDDDGGSGGGIKHFNTRTTSDQSIAGHPLSSTRCNDKPIKHEEKSVTAEFLQSLRRARARARDRSSYSTTRRDIPNAVSP